MMGLKIETIFLYSHITILVLGVCCFGVSFLAGLAYILQQKRLKTKNLNSPSLPLPSLEELDQVAMRSIFVGLLLLTGGVVSGIYLAHVFWKSSWLSEPKFVFALVTWGWYLAVVVLRNRFGWRGIRFFVLTVVGFAFLLFTFALATLWGWL